MTRVLSVSRDVTDRILRERRIKDHEDQMRLQIESQHRMLREKEELLSQKDLLTREIDHRVKNSLSMVAGLLRLQMRNAGQAERSGLENAVRRVNQIARVHNELYRSSDVVSIDLASYLHQLSRDLCETGASGAVAVDLDVEPVSMGSQQITALGLIVAELIANSLRHGFRDRDKGTVRLQAYRRDDELVIEVSDDGCGLPDDFDGQKSDGLGMRLINAQVSLLKARFEHGPCEDGAGSWFRISMPMVSEQDRATA